MMRFFAYADSPHRKEVWAYTLQGLKDLTMMWPHYNWKYFELQEVR